MDNVSFHKREDRLGDMREQGIILEFLPLYSPDLNPIEKKWAQIKSVRKKLRCDDIDKLFSEHTDYATL